MTHRFRSMFDSADTYAFVRGRLEEIEAEKFAPAEVRACPASFWLVDHERGTLSFRGAEVGHRFLGDGVWLSWDGARRFRPEPEPGYFLDRYRVVDPER